MGGQGRPVAGDPVRGQAEGVPQAWLNPPHTALAHYTQETPGCQGAHGVTGDPSSGLFWQHKGHRSNSSQHHVLLEGGD